MLVLKECMLTTVHAACKFCMCPYPRVSWRTQQQVWQWLHKTEKDKQEDKGGREKKTSRDHKHWAVSCIPEILAELKTNPFLLLGGTLGKNWKNWTYSLRFALKHPLIPPTQTLGASSVVSIQTTNTISKERHDITFESRHWTFNRLKV